MQTGKHAGKHAGGPQLIAASKNGQVEKVQELISNGAMLDLQDKVRGSGGV